MLIPKSILLHLDSSTSIDARVRTARMMAEAFDAEAAAADGGRDPLNNLRHLVQLLEHGGDVDELVEHAKLEMFLDQSFVFTPKGELISLPRGAMPLDFAYAVHTSVGDSAVGAKINGELKPLRTVLQNGDVVEIVRGPQTSAPVAGHRSHQRHTV